MRHVLILVLILSSVAAAAFAQTPLAPVPTLAQDAAARERARLANWWQKSAASLDPIPVQALFHLEGTVAYQNYAGNNDGNVFIGRGQFVWRKQRFSNYWTYSHTEQDVTFGAGTGSVHLTKYNLVPVVQYDILPAFYVAAGGRKMRDDSFNVDDRQVAYGGVGTVATPHPSLLLGVMAAVGYHDTDFRAGGTGVAMSGRAFYLEANWNWAIDPRVSLAITADYLRYRQESGARDGSTLNVEPGLTLAVSNNVALTLGYTVNREENAIVTLTGLQRVNRTSAVGLRLSY